MKLANSLELDARRFEELVNRPTAHVITLADEAPGTPLYTAEQNLRVAEGCMSQIPSPAAAVCTMRVYHEEDTHLRPCPLHLAVTFVEG